MKQSNSPTKKPFRIGSYQQQISFIKLTEIEDWISLSSGYHNFILKDTLYREQIGSLKMSYSDLRLFKAIPDLFSRIFLYTLAALDYFFFYFNLILYPPAILPCFSKLRESTQGMAVLTRREVDDGVRATVRFLSKVQFFPFFRSWFKGSKEGLDPHSEHLKITKS